MLRLVCRNVFLSDGLFELLGNELVSSCSQPYEEKHCLGDFPAWSDSGIANLRSYSLLNLEQVANCLSCNGPLSNQVSGELRFGRLDSLYCWESKSEKVLIYLDNRVLSLMCNSFVNKFGKKCFLKKKSWCYGLVCNSAYRKLCFMRRSLSGTNSDVTTNDYKTLVRPTLEYATIIWDTKKHTNPKR